MREQIKAVVRGVAAMGLTLCCAERAVAEGSHLAVGWNDPEGRTGFVGAISTDAPWQFLTEPLRVGPDPLLRYAQGHLYVLNSRDDMLRVIDPQTWTFDRTFSLEAGSVPVDIAVTAPSTAYVTVGGDAIVRRVDPASGRTVPVLDLGQLAERGAVPELGTMQVHEGRLFIQVRRLNRDETGGRPSLAVMDLVTEQLIDVDPVREGVQTIELAGTSPKGTMQVVAENRRLWVNATGGFFDDGGIEAVNLDTLRSEGLAIHEDAGETGADINAFVMLSARNGYLTYSTDLLASSHLHRFSAEGVVDPAELHVTVDYLTPAMEFDARTNQLFLPSSGFELDGIHVFDATSGRRLTDEPIATSGSPTSLVLIPEPSEVLLMVAGLFISSSKRRRPARCVDH